jgi:diguanylate cyclase (GGDEF)-like protein
MILLSEFVANYGRLFEMSAQLKKANLTLEELSLQDGLTGLANRRSFDQYLTEQVGVATRTQRPLSLMVCDVDHFKLFNDHYGHQEGDECLKQVAMALKSCCRRPADKACRYGGEEFALVLPDTDLAGAEQIAQTVREAIAKLNIPHQAGAAPYVSLSGGVAVLVPAAGTTDADLLKAADTALYQAKNQGRNRIISA